MVGPGPGRLRRPAGLYPGGRGDRDMSVVATVAGIPVLVDEVDAAETRLRGGPGAAALPAGGTSEGRQLRRWLTQLIVTERLVA
ncbi:malonyl CoA-ACP transacylase, partial [Mycobacterium nebraskense]